MTKSEQTTERYGIRVSLPQGDPFSQLLSDDWNTTHWYASQTARDLALQDMSRQHEYSRQGDAPALVFNPIERNGSSA
jgi:hypothetical protein